MSPQFIQLSKLTRHAVPPMTRPIKMSGDIC
jgi:hypothetical protein